MQPISDYIKQKAFQVYYDILSKKFQNQWLTSAMIYRLNDELKEIQLIKQQQESHLVWKIPVKVIAIDQIRFTVVEDK